MNLLDQPPHFLTSAENTPAMEADGLQADLHRAGIERWAWINDNSILVAKPTAAPLRQRANNEPREIDAARSRHAGRHALAALLPDEPAGVERLLQLSGHSIAQADVASNREPA